MKKFSSTTKANSHRSWWTSFRIAGIGVVLLLAVAWAAPTIARSVGGAVLTPVLALEEWLQHSTAALPSYVRSRAALEAELTSLETELAQSAALTAERDALLAQLSAASSTPAYADMIVATSIAQPPTTPYDRIIINRGSQHGVAVGAPVFASELVVIGSVVSVSARYSVIELLSSPGLSSTVYVFGPDIYTTAVGQGGGVLRIGVPQGIVVNVGDPVAVPAALPAIFGSVSHIDTAATRPEQYIFVSLPLTLQSLRTVYVAEEPLPPQSFEEARDTVAVIRDSLFAVPVPEGVLVDIAATSSATSTNATTTATTSSTDI